jgi:hypothetical protein
MSYTLLAQQSTVIRQQYPDALTEEDMAWEESPFDWFRKKASATKGKIGRDLVFSLIQAAGFQPARRGMGIEVNGKTVRVKLSMMWGAGSLTFEQIKNDPFDYLACLGLYPDNSYGWLIPKDELIVDGNAQEREGFSGQHTAPGELPSDFWLQNVSVVNPYQWLTQYGGTTVQMSGAIQQLLG